MELKEIEDEHPAVVRGDAHGFLRIEHVCVWKEIKLYLLYHF